MDSTTDLLCQYKMDRYAMKLTCLVKYQVHQQDAYPPYSTGSIATNGGLCMRLRPIKSKILSGRYRPAIAKGRHSEGLP